MGRATRNVDISQSALRQGDRAQSRAQRFGDYIGQILAGEPDEFGGKLVSFVIPDFQVHGDPLVSGVEK